MVAFTELRLDPDHGLFKVWSPLGLGMKLGGAFVLEQKEGSGSGIMQLTAVRSCKSCLHKKLH